ncbi:hypothetical protein BJ742DRAFT_834950 [Cladochytrium replicatum]|nr:hypothetical protein BJ742DRAFT_834950 [Cladochytrium replicatum]
MMIHSILLLHSSCFFFVCGHHVVLLSVFRWTLCGSCVPLNRRFPFKTLRVNAKNNECFKSPFFIIGETMGEVCRET